MVFWFLDCSANNNVVYRLVSLLTLSVAQSVLTPKQVTHIVEDAGWTVILMFAMKDPGRRFLIKFSLLLYKYFSGLSPASALGISVVALLLFFLF